MTIVRARLLGSRTIKHQSLLDRPSSGAATCTRIAGKGTKCIFSFYNLGQKEYSSASSSSSSLSSSSSSSSSLSKGCSYKYGLQLDSNHNFSSMAAASVSDFCFPAYFGTFHSKNSKTTNNLVVPLAPPEGRSPSSKRWMSTTIDGIKVDITRVEAKSPNNSKTDGKDDGDGDGDSSSSSSSPMSTSKLKKSHQQEAEEDIFMLNAHLKEHFQHANYTEGLTTCHTILDKSIELFGPTNNEKFHPSIASAYNNMGLMHKMMGDFEESREHYHEALRIYEEIVGKDHASYAAALNNLGNLDRAQSMSDADVEEPDNSGDGGGGDADSDGKESGSGGGGGGGNGGSKALSSLERMQLNDSAVIYFEEAYRIRKVELGEEHVYTVTSRTNLGGAIAAQVLQGEQFRQKRLRELQEQKKEGKGDEPTTATATATATAWTPSKYTKEKWDVAEEHLRAAFRMSVNSPRGEQVVAPSSTSSSSSASSRKDDGLPTRSEYKAMSKKEKNKVDKLRRKLKKERERTADAGTNIDNNIRGGTTGAGTGTGVSMNNNGLGVGDIKICTLSSAAAGQNLAVFLKSRADLISNAVDINADDDEDSSADDARNNDALDSGDMYSEANNLYLGALRVRTALKGDIHPDTVATKFSLAELIDALGDEEGANVLRQQLLDAYQVEEGEDADGR